MGAGWARDYYAPVVVKMEPPKLAPPELISCKNPPVLTIYIASARRSRKVQS